MNDDTSQDIEVPTETTDIAARNAYEAHVAAVVAALGPPKPGQLDRIAVLLRPDPHLPAVD